MNRIEIKDGKLSSRETRNFDKWNYSFEEYLLSNYSSSPQIIADFYVDEIIEMRLRDNDMIKHGEDPSTYDDPEEYEDLLRKLNSYKGNISIEKVKEIEAWLNEKIAD